MMLLKILSISSSLWVRTTNPSLVGMIRVTYISFVERIASSSSFFLGSFEFDVFILSLAMIGIWVGGGSVVYLVMVGGGGISDPRLPIG